MYFDSCWRRHIHNTVVPSWLCMSDTVSEQALGIFRYILLQCLTALLFYCHVDPSTYPWWLYLKITITKSVSIKSRKFLKYISYLHIILSTVLVQCFFLCPENPLNITSTSRKTVQLRWIHLKQECMLLIYYSPLFSIPPYIDNT